MSGLKAAPVKIMWHPGLPIFSSEAFLKVVGDEYGWLGGFADSGTVRCILPYTIIKKASFRMVRFRVETIPFGEKVELAEEKAFLNSAVEYFRSIGADLILPATNNTIFRTYPDGAVVAPYGSYVIDLNNSEDALWSNLHPKHRNVIRNATKRGVQIRSGSEFERIAYELVRDTLKRSKLGFMPYGEFQRLIQSFHGNAKIFVAEYEGVAQGCAVVPFSQYGAYYVYGGSISEPVTGALNLLHWELIRHFRSLDVKRYDFVGTRIKPEKGSKQEGLSMFKQRFGGTLIQGFMWKYAFHSWKYSAYSLGIRLLRGGDIVDQESHKVVIQPSLSETVPNAEMCSPQPPKAQ